MRSESHFWRFLTLQHILELLSASAGPTHPQACENTVLTLLLFELPPATAQLLSHKNLTEGSSGYLGVFQFTATCLDGSCMSLAQPCISQYGGDGVSGTDG